MAMEQQHELTDFDYYYLAEITEGIDNDEDDTFRRDVESTVDTIGPNGFDITQPWHLGTFLNENYSLCVMRILGFRLKFTGFAKLRRQSLATEYSLGQQSYSKALYISFSSTNPDIRVAFRLEQQCIDSGDWIRHNNLSFNEGTVPIKTQLPNGQIVEQFCFCICTVGTRVPVPNPTHRIIATIIIDNQFDSEVVVMGGFKRGGKNVSSRVNNTAMVQYVYA